MADENNNQPAQRARRSSFAGQTFADLFGTGRPSVSRPDNGQNQTGQFPGPITTAAAQAQQRRLSIATLGLSGSPNSTSPYGSFRGRRESISSANSGSIDESAIEDEPAGARDANTSTPATPFARRMSFGARAMRDIRTSTGGGGNSGGGGGSPGQNGRSSPSSHARAPSASLTSATNTTGTISSRDGKGRGLSSLHSAQRRPLSLSTSPSSPSSPSYQGSFIPFRRLTVAALTGEGFNWSENLRSRAERGSIAAPGGGQPGMPVGANHHARAKSVATMEPPVQEMPRAAASKKPDHFQERILKGDFYMD